jgi:hypothetical protein
MARPVADWIRPHGMAGSVRSDVLWTSRIGVAG